MAVLPKVRPIVEKADTGGGEARPGGGWLLSIWLLSTFMTGLRAILLVVRPLVGGKPDTRGEEPCPEATSPSASGDCPLVSPPGL